MKPALRHLLTVPLLLVSWPAAAAAPADEALSGGDTTVFITGANAFATKLRNISTQHRREFSVGNSFFNTNWVIAPASPDARDGLGPFFHTRSCSACHTLDGRGAPPGLEPAGSEPSPALLFRLSLPGAGEHGAPLPVPAYGLQLQPKALPGLEPEGRIVTTWTEKPGQYPDGTAYSLLAPSYAPADWKYGPPPADLLLSPRIAMAIHGGGLLEAIPEADLAAAADPDDANHDGISGRLNQVWDREKGAVRPGRFGWKANEPGLLQQTADAFNGDMGLTSRLAPLENVTEAQRPAAARFPSGGQDGGPEVSDLVLDRVVTYLRTLAPPARRNVADPEVVRGRALFDQVQCAACHRPEWKTGDVPDLTELANQTIRPWTDLLLHDMGEALADHRPDFLATGTEWRTPPLWGLGLQKVVNGHTRLLHDGRARNVEESILWHGGEAQNSTDLFKKLPAADRAALLRFLDSL